FQWQLGILSSMRIRMGGGNRKDLTTLFSFLLTSRLRIIRTLQSMNIVRRERSYVNGTIPPSMTFSLLIY
ncbi:hypothetical protein PENTCL1PPCAC_2011, partial [Pristionchus entomophagus]